MQFAENSPMGDAGLYAQALAGEGEYWDNFIANRLLQHDEIPGSVDFRIFFTQFSYKHNWGPPCLGPIAINFREREIRYILQQASRTHGMRVLDLGCGAGWLGLELARQGAHVTAVDISPTNLALGRYMAETNARNFPFLYQRFAGLPCELERFGSVEYVYGDLNAINLPIAKFDAVVVWDSLHHVINIERLLEQVRATLKPGGMFLGVDHAFASPLTAAFNEVIAPLILNLNSWVGEASPEWLYRGVNELARSHDWDVLGVDYDIAPIPGFKAFEAQVRDEMLEIIRNGLRQEALDKLQSAASPTAQISEEASPFEDVSATHLMAALIDNFKAVEFRTICPLIMPEKHFSTPRDEAERIFQHYLSAMLVEVSEQAVRHGQADGQWFFFHLDPQRPAAGDLTPNLLKIKSSRSLESIEPILPARAGGVLAGLAELASRFSSMQEEMDKSAGELRDKTMLAAQLEANLAQHSSALEESRSYAAHVEAELARKNAALATLERRVQELEAEVIAARAPRLPWK